MNATQTATSIATALGETEDIPVRQIGQVLEALGEERTKALLEQTLSIEQQGGLMVPDGSRRRSPGGVFFHLVRQELPRDAKQRIFYTQGDGKPKAPKPEAPFKSKRPRIIEVAKEIQPPKARRRPFGAQEEPATDRDGARERIRAILSGLSATVQRELLLELISEVRPEPNND
jgi:hypothetical protein